MKIAVLVCSYNRRDVTLEFLDSLKEQIRNARFSYDIFLTDDNSPDNTAYFVRERHPDVRVYSGSGSLFWGGGMNTSWRGALEDGDFDCFLWMNDDIKLVTEALTILERDVDILSSSDSAYALCGTCISGVTKQPTYGGRTSNGELIKPTGSLERCDMFNGNFVLIMSEISESLGLVDEVFTHSLGDFDYGLRLQQQGYSSWLCSGVVAICERNEVLPCFNDNLPFKERWANFNKILGFNISEYSFFCRRHYSLTDANLRIAKAYLRCLLPRLYNLLK